MTSPPRAGSFRRRFQEVEHTADRALRIYGRDLAELFTHAALGMNSLMQPTAADRTSMAKEIALEAIDAESLLVAWLSELSYWAETESLLFTRFEILMISPTRLRAKVHGGRAEAIEQHVKAVTFHNLQIRSDAGGFTTTVVFDV